MSLVLPFWRYSDVRCSNIRFPISHYWCSDFWYSRMLLVYTCKALTWLQVLHAKQHDVTRRRELSVLTCKAITRAFGLTCEAITWRDAPSRTFSFNVQSCNMRFRFDMRSNNMTPCLHAKQHDVTRRRDTQVYRARYKHVVWRLTLPRDFWRRQCWFMMTRRN